MTIQNKQSGQSLIETIIAIFLLTTAMAAGVGLATYSFSTSSNSQNSIIASNLAREGVEVIRMMRDTNWLADDAKGAAWDLQSCADIGGRACYPRALATVANFISYDLTNSGNHRVIFDATTNVWTRDSTADYNLYLQSNGSYTPTSNGTSVFARMINITFNTAAPYTGQNSNQEVIVKSVVAWRDKKCPAFNSTDNLLTLTTTCKIIVEEHLTNWKDYK